MKLSSINLNLLIALDALLEEQSVSKAASRLNLSQAQLSNILKELRAIFEDELLIRGPERQMILTEKANSLIIPVNEAINKFHEVFVGEKPFKPEKANIFFNIGMNSYISTSICPAIYESISSSSPGITFDALHISSLKDYRDFTDRNLDLAIGTYELGSKHICKEKIMTSNFVGSVSKEHPLYKKKEITKNDLRKYPIIMVVFSKGYRRVITQLLDSNIGKNKYRCYTIPHVIAVMNVLQRSNSIAITNVTDEATSEKLAAQFDYGFLQLPFETPQVEYYMYWKKVDTNNPANKWLREQIKAIFIKSN